MKVVHVAVSLSREPVDISLPDLVSGGRIVTGELELEVTRLASGGGPNPARVPQRSSTQVADGVGALVQVVGGSFGGGPQPDIGYVQGADIGVIEDVTASGADLAPANNRLGLATFNPVFALFGEVAGEIRVTAFSDRPIECFFESTAEAAQLDRRSCDP